MNKGSEWRKWDLHIHTPGTAKKMTNMGVLEMYGNNI